MAGLTPSRRMYDISSHFVHHGLMQLRLKLKKTREYTWKKLTKDTHDNLNEEVNSFLQIHFPFHKFIL